MESNPLPTIVVIGKTQSGKSSVINMILQDHVSGTPLAKVGNSMVSCTTEIKEYIGPLRFGNHTVVRLVDGPGLDDSAGRDQQFLNMLTSYFKKNAGNIHLVLFILKRDVMSAKQQEMIIQYQTLLGCGGPKPSSRHFGILVTHCDMSIGVMKGFIKYESLPASLLEYREDHSEMLNELKPRWGNAFGPDYKFFEPCTLQPMDIDDAALKHYIWQKLTEQIENYILDVQKHGLQEIGNQAQAIFTNELITRVLDIYQVYTNMLDHQIDYYFISDGNSNDDKVIGQGDAYNQKDGKNVSYQSRLREEASNLGELEIWNAKYFYLDKYQRDYAHALEKNIKEIIQADLTNIFRSNFDKMMMEIKKLMATMDKWGDPIVANLGLKVDQETGELLYWTGVGSGSVIAGVVGYSLAMGAQGAAGGWACAAGTAAFEGALTSGAGYTGAVAAGEGAAASMMTTIGATAAAASAAALIGIAGGMYVIHKTNWTYVQAREDVVEKFIADSQIRQPKMKKQMTQQWAIVTATIAEKEDYRRRLQAHKEASYKAFK